MQLTIQGQKFFMDTLEHMPKEIRTQVDLSMGISDRIADILEERGMTQKDFARLMGKTEAEVSRWLAGRHNFTLATLAKISSALGTDIIKVIH